MDVKFYDQSGVKDGIYTVLGDEECKTLPADGVKLSGEITVGHYLLM